jgi:hypothetical protein
LEEEKKNMAQAQIEGTTLIQEEITTQSMESLTRKSTQVKERGRELVDKFHSLKTTIEGVHTN